MPRFGTFRFGTSLYGGGMHSATVYPDDPLVYGTFSLSDGESMILTRLNVSGPTRKLIEGSVPRGHGKYLTADYFEEYIIEAEGIAKKSTAAALDAFIDTIKKTLRAREGTLDYTDANGTVKRFTATLINFEELFAGRLHYHTTFVPWVMRFKCVSPFAKSRSYSSLLTTFTSSPQTAVVPNTGSAVSYPVFVLVFNSASSVTAASVQNDETGESLTYTGSIAAGDYLEFDSEQKTVKKNGTEVDYSGAFPVLLPDDNQVRFTVTGSSFNVSATTKWKPAYL